MMTYKKGDVVVVPFPFSNINKSKPRPALVVSNETFNNKTGHSLLAMITTAAQTHWYNDVMISELDDAGLSVKSFIRFKLFSLDNRIIAKKIGELSPEDQASFDKEFDGLL